MLFCTGLLFAPSMILLRGCPIALLIEAMIYSIVPFEHTSVDVTKDLCPISEEESPISRLPVSEMTDIQIRRRKGHFRHSQILKRQLCDVKTMNDN